MNVDNCEIVFLAERVLVSCQLAKSVGTMRESSCQVYNIVDWGQKGLCFC